MISLNWLNVYNLDSRFLIYDEEIKKSNAL